MHSFQKWHCFLPFRRTRSSPEFPLFWNQSGAQMLALLATLLLALPLLLTLQKFVAFARLAEASHQLQRVPNQHLQRIAFVVLGFLVSLSLFRKFFDEFIVRFSPPPKKFRFFDKQLSDRTKFICVHGQGG